MMSSFPSNSVSGGFTQAQGAAAGDAAVDHHNVRIGIYVICLERAFFFRIEREGEFKVVLTD